MAIQEVRVPDIGNATDVDIIEVLVAPGDEIEAEQSLITLESDKASMEIPAPAAGKITELKVAVGDKVSEGSVILMLEVAGSEQAVTESAPAANEQAAPQAAPAQGPQLVDVPIPDIGDATAEVIEIQVAEGDNVSVEDPLITLEGDKASMEIPSPHEGTVKAIKVALGDKVNQGDIIIQMEAVIAASDAPAQTTAASSAPAAPAVAPAPQMADIPAGDGVLHAGPAVRRIAYEFGIDLQKIRGSGRKGRIVKADLQAYVKGAIAKAEGGGISMAPAAPAVDFSKFGEIETKPLSKIQKISGPNLHRNWVTIPHVTQFDEADITELEAYRKQKKAEAEKQGYKLTPLVFIMKAVVASLKQHPTVNASLDANGENLILKKYYNIGVAVDTPNGLVVPVIRDVDQKSVMDLAKELGDISLKAREKGLTTKEMQGSCFTISSLGGISGTAFTPIINAPDVAILGVSKAAMKPHYQDGTFVPRLKLPLSFSYDHRVIDGAEGARFTKTLTATLSEIRDLLL